MGGGVVSVMHEPIDPPEPRRVKVPDLDSIEDIAGFYGTPIESGGDTVSTTVDGVEYWAVKR